MSNNNENNLSLSIDDQTTLLTIMNKRHRSAAKSFKSPPQPKFCIKESLQDGREVFINVLSYSRIANQLSEFDPIPLYGGMQIRSLSLFKNSLQQQYQQEQLSSTSAPPPPPPPPPQLIFAVMASPEVLKKSGRNYPESPEQMNLVELMCEFVEAMNPGLTLSKKPQILKDRDLTGELKDIWSAVQNFRDKEKAGVSDIVVYTEFGPESASTAQASPLLTRPSVDIFSPNTTTTTSIDKSSIDHKSNSSEINGQKQNEEDEELDSPPPHIKSNLENHINDHHSNEVNGNNKANSKSNNNNNNHDGKEHDDKDNAVVVIEKLSLGDNCAGSKKSKNSNNTNIANNNNNFNNENESSEKLVKVQNQKNKESHQHHFFPKFLTSSKDKDKDTKEKDKEKEKQHDESSLSQETTAKVKTKKSLNFFRRNKTSATSSPTHTPTTTTNTSSSNQQQKSDAE